MTEYGESKSGFRDEDVAGGRDEGKAARFGPALVVARDDHSFACIFEQYLRRAQYVTCCQKGRIHSARQPKRLAIGDRHSAVLLAVTQRHDGDSLGRSHGTAMPAARMIVMAVGYQCGVARTGGIYPAEIGRASGRERVCKYV